MITASCSACIQRMSQVAHGATKVGLAGCCQDSREAHHKERPQSHALHPGAVTYGVVFVLHIAPSDTVCCELLACKSQFRQVDVKAGLRATSRRESMRTCSDFDSVEYARRRSCALAAVLSCSTKASDASMPDDTQRSAMTLQLAGQAWHNASVSALRNSIRHCSGCDWFVLNRVLKSLQPAPALLFALPEELQVAATTRAAALRYKLTCHAKMIDL